MDRVTYTPPTSELPLVGPEEPADAVPDGHQRSPFVELDRQTWARLASEMAQPFDQADVERLRGLGLRTNAELGGSLLHGALRPPRPVTAPLERAMDRGSLTARGHQRVLRVAWTLADLEGRGVPVLDDVDTALYFRSLVPA